MPACTLKPAAYGIPILHAAAHPSSTVLGLLLGTVSGDSVVIDDALPLVHRYTSLSPTAELGLALATARAEQSGKRVVGVYAALAEGEGLGRAGENLLKAVGAQYPGAIGLALDNDKLTTSEPAYVVVGGADITFPAESVRAGTLKLVREKGTHNAVRDLDDHLDDARVEWMHNLEVHKAIAALA